MFDSNTLQRYDPQGIHKKYDMWPEIAREAYESTQDCIDFKNTLHFAFAGVGGSRLINEVLISLLSKEPEVITADQGLSLIVKFLAGCVLL